MYAWIGTLKPYFTFLTNTFYFFFLGRGGQSALRFARLRMEKRHNYVRKVAETAVQLFITNDRVFSNFIKIRISKCQSSHVT